MDFTREPIIETIITPKEGCKLVIRSSKSTGQEEYFVDAVEIIAFGHALFFRSLERPKAFLVPVSDYEVLEVREARMVLKNVGLDRSIKIGGGREGGLKTPREIEKAPSIVHEEAEEPQFAEEGAVSSAEGTAEGRPERLDKKRDRRRHYRKRRGREEGVKEEATESGVPPLEDERIDLIPPQEGSDLTEEGATPLSPSILSSLLQPPPTLISETINRYRQNEMFKGAFYLTEEEQYKPHDKVHDLLNEEDDEEEAPALQDPTFIHEPVMELEHEEAEKSVEFTEGHFEPAIESPFRVGPPPIPFELIRSTEQEAALPLFAEEESLERKEERVEPQVEEPVKEEEAPSSEHKEGEEHPQ